MGKSEPSQRLLWAGFLIGAALVAFGPSLHGDFLWDDDVYVSKNLLLTAEDGLRRIWFSLDSPSQYFPLTYTTFRLERALWGLDTFGYHLVNIGLHSANSLLVWSILLALGIPGAWLAAAIFMLHPVQVESVSWITERKNLLSALFFLLALRSWVKSLSPQNPHQDRSVAVAMVFFVMALLSKTTACTLPAALILTAWISGRQIDRKRALQISGFVGLGLFFGLLTIWWESHVQHAQGAEFRLTPLEAVLVAGRALWFYAGKLAWPFDLSFSYAHWSPAIHNWRQWLWPASWIAVGAGAIIAWRRGHPQSAYGVLFFTAMLSPLLGFIPLYTFRYTYVADHYQYLACLGLIAPLCAALASYLWPQDPHIPRFHPATFVLLLGLAAVTARRSSIFADPETLWRDTLLKNPESWMAYDNLGCVLMERGQLSEAETNIKKSIALHPGDFRTHFNLGSLYVKQDRREDAIASFGAALHLQPDHVKSAFALGRLLAETGHDDEALVRYREGLAIDSRHPEIRNAIGMILARRGRFNEAAEEYRQALLLSPLYDKAHNNLANLYLRGNRVSEAIAEYRSAIELNPQFPQAYFNLAIALEKKGNHDEAVLNYKRAVSLDPGLRSKPSIQPIR